MEPIRLYLGLGDTLSVDPHPEGPGWGACSLLARNRDESYPDFAGRDLASGAPEITVACLARAGVTTRGVLEEQLFRLPADRGGRTVVTLTAGSNDLLLTLRLRGTLLEEDGEAVVRRLRSMVASIHSRLHHGLILLATLVDPSDGVGDLLAAGQPLIRGLDVVARVNDALRALAAEGDGTMLIDLHAAFLGHGSHARDARNPYHHPSDPTAWLGDLVAPNRRGADAIRRLWWQALVQGGWVEG